MQRACAFLAVFFHLALGHPLFLRIPYEQGVEYDVVSNTSFVRMAPVNGGAVFEYWYPPGCDGRRPRARKRGGAIVLEIPCEEESLVRQTAWV